MIEGAPAVPDYFLSDVHLRLDQPDRGDGSPGWSTGWARATR